GQRQFGETVQFFPIEGEEEQHAKCQQQTTIERQHSVERRQPMAGGRLRPLRYQRPLKLLPAEQTLLGPVQQLIAPSYVVHQLHLPAHALSRSVNSGTARKIYRLTITLSSETTRKSCGMLTPTKPSINMAKMAEITISRELRILLAAMTRERSLSAVLDWIKAYSGTMSKPPKTPRPRLQAMTAQAAGRSIRSNQPSPPS